MSAPEGTAPGLGDSPTPVGGAQDSATADTSALGPVLPLSTSTDPPSPGRQNLDLYVPLEGFMEGDDHVPDALTCRGARDTLGLRGPTLGDVASAIRPTEASYSVDLTGSEDESTGIDLNQNVVKSPQQLFEDLEIPVRGMKSVGERVRQQELVDELARKAKELSTRENANNNNGDEAGKAQEQATVPPPATQAPPGLPPPPLGGIAAPAAAVASGVPPPPGAVAMEVDDPAGVSVQDAAPTSPAGGKPPAQAQAGTSAGSSGQWSSEFIPTMELIPGVRPGRTAPLPWDRTMNVEEMEDYMRYEWRNRSCPSWTTDEALREWDQRRTYDCDKRPFCWERKKFGLATLNRDFPRQPAYPFDDEAASRSEGGLRLS